MHAEAGGAAPAPRWETRGAPRSALLLYALCAASFTLYTPVWVYATARDLQADDRFPRTPLIWALGSLATPLCALLLYDFRRGVAPSRPRWWAALPGGLHLGIATALFLLPTGPLWVASALLLPIPVAWVQATLNARAGRRAATRGSWRRAADVATLVIGASLVMLAGWRLDWPAVSRALVESQPSQSTVLGTSRLYTITTQSEGWRQLEPGSLVEDETDLELLSKAEDAWVIAYTLDAGSNSIDDIVQGRRALIERRSTLLHFAEVRSFLPNSDLVAVSTARYGVKNTALHQSEYIVLTIASEPKTIELIGFTTSPSLRREELNAILNSFALVAPAEEP